MFGIAKDIRSEVRECTPDLLNAALDSVQVAKVCAELEDALEKCRRGELTRDEYETLKGALKKRLPILTFHATFKNGRRKNDEAIPSGLSIYDLDHIENPRERWLEIEPRKDELGIMLSHITPSTEGLRLVFVMPQGMNLADAQAWMARQLGDTQYDACVKDYARCSFAVPREYVLWMDVDALFAPYSLYSPQSTPSSTELLNNPADEEKEKNSVELRVLRGENQDYPQTYEDIPYSQIVETLEEQMGGQPEHGSRNNFIFSMACHLRYVCNDDAGWIAQILPTYGEARDKWMATIRSACARSQTKQMPCIMKRTLAICKERLNEEL
ncbi:MAG: VirE protein, partial [Bacteroides sp.]|nr:VirE protein [Bacteroides sp.]